MGSIANLPKSVYTFSWFYQFDGVGGTYDLGAAPEHVPRGSAVRLFKLSCWTESTRVDAAPAQAYFQFGRGKIGQATATAMLNPLLSGSPNNVYAADCPVEWTLSELLEGGATLYCQVVSAGTPGSAFAGGAMVQGMIQKG